MNYKKSCANAGYVCILLATSIIIVATSKVGPSKTDGTFAVQSDCINPVIETTVSVSSGEITTPGLSYTDLGFPQDTVDGRTVAGVVDGAQRICALTYGMENGKEWIFSCYDDGEFVCNIVLD